MQAHCAAITPRDRKWPYDVCACGAPLSNRAPVAPWLFLERVNEVLRRPVVPCSAGSRGLTSPFSRRAVQGQRAFRFCLTGYLCPFAPLSHMFLYHTSHVFIDYM